MVQEYIGKGGEKKKKNISSKIKIFKKKKKANENSGTK